jgi:hydrogenase-4 membrane subunit HyfE
MRLYLIQSIRIFSELSSLALSASMSLISIGLFIMISRKKPLMQMLGILIFRINKTFDSIDTDMLKNLIG